MKNKTQRFIKLPRKLVNALSMEASQAQKSFDEHVSSILEKALSSTRLQRTLKPPSDVYEERWLTMPADLDLRLTKKAMHFKSETAELILQILSAHCLTAA